MNQGSFVDIGVLREQEILYRDTEEMSSNKSIRDHLAFPAVSKKNTTAAQRALNRLSGPDCVPRLAHLLTMTSRK